MTEGFDVGLEMSGHEETFNQIFRGDESRRQDRRARYPTPGEVTLDLAR